MAPFFCKMDPSLDLDDYSHPFPEEDEALLRYSHMDANRYHPPPEPPRIPTEAEAEAAKKLALREAAYRLMTSCPGDEFVPPNHVFLYYCYVLARGKRSINPLVESDLTCVIQHRTRLAKFIDDAVDRYQLNRPQWRTVLDYNPNEFAQAENAARSEKWLRLSLENLKIGMYFHENPGQGAGFAMRANGYVLACLWKTSIPCEDCFRIMEKIRDDFDQSGIKETPPNVRNFLIDGWLVLDKGRNLDGLGSA